MISCIINLDAPGKIGTIWILTSQRKSSSTEMSKTKALFDCQENGRKEGKMGEKKNFNLVFPASNQSFIVPFRSVGVIRGQMMFHPCTYWK